MSRRIPIECFGIEYRLHGITDNLYFCRRRGRIFILRPRKIKPLKQNKKDLSAKVAAVNAFNKEKIIQYSQKINEEKHNAYKDIVNSFMSELKERQLNISTNNNCSNI